MSAIVPERTLKSERVFEGRLLQVDVLEVAVEGGRRSRREVVRHPGAAAVWAQTTAGRFVFVRQYRKAAERSFLEIVAGLREPGESAADCARREVREETGFAVSSLRPLGAIFTTPGYCTERIDIFAAQLGERGPAQPDADERLEVVLLDAREWLAMMARGVVQDAKSLAAWSLLMARQQSARQADQWCC